MREYIVFFNEGEYPNGSINNFQRKALLTKATTLMREESRIHETLALDISDRMDFTLMPRKANASKPMDTASSTMYFNIESNFDFMFCFVRTIATNYTNLHELIYSNFPHFLPFPPFPSFLYIPFVLISAIRGWIFKFLLFRKSQVNCSHLDFHCDRQIF